MRSKVFATNNNEVRESRWILVQHDDRSLHVEQEATYHADGQLRKRSVSINEFLMEDGPPPRSLRQLIDRLFDDAEHFG